MFKNFGQAVLIKDINVIRDGVGGLAVNVSS